MGLAVLIVTVGPIVPLVLLVVVIHSGDIFLVCLYSDLFDCDFVCDRLFESIS